LLAGIDRVDEREQLFHEIVDAVRELMDLNNEIMIAVRQTLWWHKYIKMTLIVIVSYLLQRYVMNAK
jgi:hypothetical protein